MTIKQSARCKNLKRCLLLASFVLIVRGQQQPTSEQLEGNNEVSPPSFVQQFEGRRHEIARLERRLDRLEFELRKSVHQMQQQQPLAESTTSQSAGDSTANSRRLIDLSERLNLVEKFITISTSKMYELEMKVKQLEKCECQMSCKIAKSTITESYETNEIQEDQQNSLGQQKQPEVKRDGQVWRDKCNICSCHRGRVSCQQVHCPAPKCDNPQAIAGKCCPVCYKSCSFRRQQVRHGDKLVINSNEQTCKECLCLDGRFKCQRVNLMAKSGRLERAIVSNQTSSLYNFDDADSDYKELADGRDDDNDVDDEEDDDDDEDDDAGQAVDGMPRRLRKRESAPLFCPLVDCPPSEQIKLPNDCCTYCARFDFCSWLPGEKQLNGRCHPNAVCRNTALAYAAPPTHNSTSLRSLEALFTCECRPGFKGDGRLQCDDVNECADERLNDCDPKTTRCVNLLGGYECQCRRGFRWSQFELDESNANSNANSNSNPRATRQITTIQAGDRRALQRCHDVDECRDGKLNRCHPQARCSNTQGAYKCACRRGYLGNGFECHKWFTSSPQVAAYLHRHVGGVGVGGGVGGFEGHGPEETGPGPEAEVVASESNASSTGSAARLALPLDDLDDRELDDQLDDDLSAGHAQSLTPPKLSDSTWEPLQLFASSTNDNADDHDADQQNNHQPPLNTRTMLVQKPPRLPRPRPWWDQQPEVADQSTPTSMTSAPATTAAHNLVVTTATIEQPQNHQSIQSPLAHTSQAPSNLSTTSSINTTTTNSSSTNDKKVAGKKGAIIASAAISSRRGGMASNPNGRVFSPLQQSRSQMGVTTSGASASSKFITQLLPSQQHAKTIGGVIMTTASALTDSIWHAWATYYITSSQMLTFGLLLSLASSLQLLFYNYCIQINHIVTIYSS